MMGRNDMKKSLTSRYSALVSQLPIPKKKKGAAVIHVDEPRGTAIIELTKRKKEESLGITVSGGTDKGRLPFISNIRAGGIADRSDYFCSDEDIISINGIDVREFKHSEIIQLVQQAGKTVTFEVQYKLPAQDKKFLKTALVLLQTDENGLGFTVKGGESKDTHIKRPVTITEIEENSTASRSGQLMPGDEIVKVNGKSLSGMHISQVKDVLSFVRNDYTLEIRYYATPIEPHVFQDGSIAVELMKPTEDSDPGLTFDVSLDFEDHGSIIMVSEIHPGSAAERAGCICVGDLVLSVNGMDFEGLCLEDAVHVLLETPKVVIMKLFPCASIRREAQTLEPLLSLFEGPKYDRAKLRNGKMTNSPASSPRLRRQRSPDAQIGSSRFVMQPVLLQDEVGRERDVAKETGKEEASLHRKAMTLSKDRVVGPPRIPAKSYGSARGCRDSPYISKKIPPAIPPRGKAGSTKCANSPAAAAQDSTSLGRSTLNSSKALNLSPLMKYLPLSCSNSVASMGSLLSQSNALEKMFTKNDVVNVRLQDSDNDFGLHVEDVTLAGLPNKIVVADLVPGGAAHRTGVILRGDRIMAANGLRTDFITAVDVERLLQETRGFADLELEISIADAVVPSSGSFTIKIHKSSIGTGLILGIPSAKDPDQYPRISEITRGSNAHRAGVLTPGDQVLQIDDTDICGLPIVEARRLLESGGEVVKLLVKKDEETQGTTFSIELEQRGQQLGISISGAESPFDPIVISGISQNGLAYRSKAVMIWDRLLAINGVTLRGKSLAEAQEMLKTQDVSVKLLIKRKLGEEREEKSNDKTRGALKNAHSWGNEGGSKDGATSPQSRDKEASAKKESDADSTGSYCEPTESSEGSETDGEPITKQSLRRDGNSILEEVMESARRSGRNTKLMLRGKSSTLPRFNTGSKPKGCGSSVDEMQRSSDSLTSKGETLESGSVVGGAGNFKRSKSFQGSSCATGSPRRPRRKSSSSRQLPLFTALSEERMDAYEESKYQAKQHANHADWPQATADQSCAEDFIKSRQFHKGSENDDTSETNISRCSRTFPGEAKGKNLGSASPPLNRSPFHSPRPSRAKLRRPDLLSFSMFSMPAEAEMTDNQSSKPTSAKVIKEDGKFPFFPVTLEQVVLQRTTQSSHTATANGFYGSTDSVSSAVVRRKTSWREATEYEFELKHHVPSVSIDYVSLRRQNSSEDFGFSVSEKVNGTGIYVRSVQPHSLAAKSGKIRRYDRILQVNGIHTRDLKCNQLVPFLQRAGRKLDMVIERRMPPSF